MGDFLATIKDIAQDCGLAVSTVSKYLNGGSVREANRLIIEDSIKKLDYTVNDVARGLKTNKSRMIGVVIPDLSNIFITTIVSVLDASMRKKGYAVLVCDCHSDEAQEQDIVNFFLRKRVDGIVSMPTSNQGKSFKPALDFGIPVVLIDRLIPELENKVSAVLVDNVKASFEATELLLTAGHKDIAVILGPQNVFTSQQRQLGYLQAMIQRGLIPDFKRIVYSDYTFNGGYESTKLLLNSNPPSAVFFTNYEMTLGGIVALNEVGVNIPNNISVVGFDNMDLSRVIQPTLTIVTQPLTEIGEQVSKILLAQMCYDNEKIKNEIMILSPKIMMGESIKDLNDVC